MGRRSTEGVKQVSGDMGGQVSEESRRRGSRVGYKRR